MVDVVGTLQSVKECIDAAAGQMQSLANLHELTLTKLPVYSQALIGLKACIDMLYDVFVQEVPVQHALRLVQVRILELELAKFKKTLDKCLAWHKSMIFLGVFPPTSVHAEVGIEGGVGVEGGVVVPKVYASSCLWTGHCLQRLPHMRRVFGVTPVGLERQVDQAFEKIQPLLQEAITLQTDILGSAVEIQHPVLRLAWMNANQGNQLNNSDVSVTAFVESLFGMLRREEGGVLVKEDFCKEVVANFVRYLDGLAGSAPDQRISLAELKQCAATNTSTTVKALLGLKQQPSVHECVVNVDVVESSMRRRTHVAFSEDVLIPPCEGYGCNWPSKVAATFVVPSRPCSAEQQQQQEEQAFLVGVHVRCCAADQGFGGTGHAQVRFQVNEDMAVPAFSVWRDRVPDGQYSFVIGPDKVKVGDTVKIWACSPPWNAWSIQVSDIDVEAKFA
jgi:hypothetical protein